MIEAGSLRNKKLVSSNKKTVGIIQNVFFEADAANPLAYILVFLAEKNWFKKYVDENWGRIGVETLTSLLPDEASTILSDVKNKGEQETIKIWKAYLKNKSNKEQSALKCYLFPSGFIDESTCNDKEVKLKAEQKDIDDFVSIGIPSYAKNSENMFAFYESSLVKDQECVIPITLNKTPVHFKTISDSKHDKGLISDVQLNVAKGQVANFVVDVMGENAGKHVVPLDEIDFDTQTIVKDKDFAGCPLLKP